MVPATGVPARCAAATSAMASMTCPDASTLPWQANPSPVRCPAPDWHPSPVWAAPAPPGAYVQHQRADREEPGRHPAADLARDVVPEQDGGRHGGPIRVRQATIRSSAAAHSASSRA
jgi:hypothetical protein